MRTRSTKRNIMENNKGFVVYGDIEALLNELTNDQAGELFRAMVAYHNTGKAPELSGVLKYVFIPIKQQMERNHKKYAEKSEKMRANALKRWQNNEAMQLHANDANTTTKTNTNTTTITKTTTTTNAALMQQEGGGSGDDDRFNIWRMLDSDSIDRIYDVYPNSGGWLIDEVYAEVKHKRREVKDPVAYILGYAKRTGWDDNADHAEVSDGLA